MRLEEMRTDFEKFGACLDVEGWGYPRHINVAEVDMALWLRYGPDVVFWFVAMGESPGELVVHACVRPEMRSRAYPREWFVIVKMIAQLLRFDRLRFLGEDGDLVASYLRRWGWETDADGLFLDLESAHNEATEDSEDSVHTG
jgi:hypothetical protein